MNIGILTHPLESNYGGILQNYALQQVLISLGHTPITIDCHPRNTIQLLKYNLKNLLYLPFSSKRRPFKWNSHIHQLFKPFAKNIMMTQYCTQCTRDIIKKHSLDAIIVGSDQVWRPRYVNNLDDMYLSFTKNLNIKRMAYAASFGTDQWEYTQAQTHKCKELISLFDYISVRETSGIKLCQQHLCVDAQKVLDPTLLLTSDNYNQLINAIPPKKQNFLLAYLLDKSETQIATIKQLAQERNLEVISISAHDDVTITVEQWLALFRDASFVLTDSFHGTVFSIIYNHDFISFANENRGSDRFASLLCALGLQNRIWGKGAEINPKIGINWDNVNAMLLAERHKSIEFLSKIWE